MSKYGFGKRNQKMKNGIKTLCFVLVMGLVFAVVSFSRKKEPNAAQDIESVRASLREQVASGKLTREEAIVKLAEAIAKLGSWEKDKDKLSQELEALGEKLKEQTDSGEITEEQAKDIWIEAAKDAKNKSDAK